jgi:hypothetical protein
MERGDKTQRSQGHTHNREEPIDYEVVYPYYRQLLPMPDLKPFALFALFVLAGIPNRERNFGERFLSDGSHPF